MNDLRQSVRDQVALFVEGYISVDSFSEGLPDVADIDEAGDPIATRIVMRSIGLISEYEMGARSEDDVRHALAAEASFVDAKPGPFSFVPREGLTVQVRGYVGTPLLAVSW